MQTSLPLYCSTPLVKSGPPSPKRNKEGVMHVYCTCIQLLFTPISLRIVSSFSVHITVVFILLIDPDMPFVIYYGLRGHRKYPVHDRNYWFRTNMTQISVLTTRQDYDDTDTTADLEEYNYRLLPQNPLSMLGNDVFLEKIETCK